MTKTSHTNLFRSVSRVRTLSMAVSCVLAGVFGATVTYAADLSRYHQFQIGSDVATILQATQQDAAKVKVLHQHPALIQELEWSPDRSGSPPEFEAVRVVVFSFCDGQLFRMFVDYDRGKTEGMSTDDLIGSISKVYGAPTRPAATMATGSQSEYAYSSSERVLARWQDPQFSLSLIASSHQPSFGLIVTSRAKDLVAQKAIVEGERLDVLAAPQIARDRANREAADERMKEEKAKLVNKPAFKP